METTTALAVLLRIDHVVGINLIKHRVRGERVDRVVELLEAESKDGQRYITEPFTISTTKG